MTRRLLFQSFFVGAMEGNCTVENLFQRVWSSFVQVLFPFAKNLVYFDNADKSLDFLAGFVQFVPSLKVAGVGSIPRFGPSICVFIVESFNVKWIRLLRHYCVMAVVVSGSETISKVTSRIETIDLLTCDWELTSVVYRDLLGRSRYFNCEHVEENAPLGLKLSSLDGTILRLSMFLKNGSLELEDGVLRGFDGYIMNVLMEKLRFTIEPLVGWKEVKYGYKMSNGSFIGTLGDVIHGRADVAANSIFVKDYGSDIIRFTTHVSSEELCVVVPSSMPKPQWKTIFLCYDFIVWILIIVSYFMAVLVWCMVVQYYTKRKASLPEASILIYKVLIGTSIVLPKRNEQRGFLAILMFAGIILSSSFNGSLLYLLKTTSFEKEVNTLAQLNSSGWPIFTHSKNLLDTFKDRGLSKKLMVTEKYDDFLGGIAEYRNFSSIGRKFETIQFVLNMPKYYGKPPVHVVRECPRNYFLSYAMRRDSPYYDLINSSLLRMSAGGLFRAYFISRQFVLTLADLEHHESTEPQALGLRNVAIAFFCLMTGITGSFLLFLGEIFFENLKQFMRRQKKRKRTNAEFKMPVYWTP